MTVSASARPSFSFKAPEARVPGEETPLFFGVLRGRSGQAPLLTIVNHVDTPFEVNGNKSHKVTLAIPPSVGLGALGEEVTRVANSIRSTHEAFRAAKPAFEEKGARWQDWNAKARDSIMESITKVLADFGITELASTQMAYRPRGLTSTPDASTSAATPAFSDFNPDNIE